MDEHTALALGIGRVEPGRGRARSKEERRVANAVREAEAKRRRMSHGCARLDGWVKACCHGNGPVCRACEVAQHTGVLWLDGRRLTRHIGPVSDDGNVKSANQMPSQLN